MKTPTVATVRNVRAALRKALPNEERTTHLNHRIRVSSNSRRTGVSYGSDGWEVEKRYSYRGDRVQVGWYNATASFPSEYTRKRREQGEERVIAALAEVGFRVFTEWTPKRENDFRVLNMFVEV
jgi:hypothetical protein